MKKFNVVDKLLPFTLTMLSKDRAVISGVRSVAEFSEEAMLFRLYDGSLKLVGEQLKIVEIGGGDVYVKGKIAGFDFGDGKKQ